MSQANQNACRRNCWAVALVAGLMLWAALLLFGLFNIVLSFLIAAVLAAVAGIILQQTICTGRGAPVAAPAHATRAAAPPPVAPPAATPPPASLASASPASAAPVSPAAAERAPAAQPPAAAAPVAAAPAAVDPATPAPATPAPATPAPATPASLLAPVVGAMPRPDASILKVQPAAGAESVPAADGGAPAISAAPAKKKTAAAARGKANGGENATGLDAAIGRAKDPGPVTTELLARPRDGKGDDLKLIKGIGPKLEALLHEVGVWHFDQIAAWKARDIAHVDGLLASFKGRITRDGWVKQARELAKAGADAAGGGQG